MKFHLFSFFAISSFLHAQITVTTLDDEDDGDSALATVDDISLREAINYSARDVMIDFAPSLDGQTILLSLAQLTISESLTIDASALPNGITIDANTSELVRRRVIEITETSTVTLNNLIITGGWTEDGANTFEDGVIMDGISGGGIFSRGNLNLFDCAIRDNRTGNGGRNFSLDDGQGGDGGFGGGIYSDGTLILNSSLIVSNQTGNGGRGNFGNYGGHGGDGGGIFATGILTLDSCSLSLNQTGDGGSSSVLAGLGGRGGRGGGLFSSGSIELRFCSIFRNQTGDGGDGGEGSASGFSFGGFGGSGGDGGGIFSGGGTPILDSCTLYQNQTGSGGDGGDFGFGNGSGGSGGNGGNGGGASFTPSAILNSCTLSHNQTGGPGNGGLGGSNSSSQLGRDGASGSGGGIASLGSRGGSSLPPPSLNSCTLSQNKTGNLGGGFFLSFTSSNIENCIIAGNTAGRDGDNVFGTIGNELGNNILSGDSVLAPLDDYGGPTLTMPPLPGSPALDTGGAADPGGSDQRGFPRFANGALDIGAVEIQGSDDTDNILSIAWPTDVDNDGVSFGVEYAIGSNFNGPDPERDFTFGNDIGEFRFGRVDPFPANVILRVVRSLDLASDDFTALVSITDSGFEILTDSDRLVESDEGDFFIFDDAVPRSPSAFYRLEADFNP